MNGAIIYNVTSKVEHGISDAWLQWMKAEHIPAMIATGCFTHAVILRLIETDESDGPTFAVQYHSGSKALYNRYIREYSSEMRQLAIDKWGAGVISFRSALQAVD